MPVTENETSEKRSFSESYHVTGKGKTRVSSTKNPLIRLLWNFYSYKRKGVDTLAGSATGNNYVLDLGSGNGAYSHWYLGKKPRSKLIAVDWSFAALKNFTGPKNGLSLRICADVLYLPFKPEIFDTIFSIDTLGHVSHIKGVLDELLRVGTCGASLFLHSECSDYQYRWPDNLLIRKNTKDVVAELDGHFSLHTSETIHSLYHQRFYIRSFFSPAGILGWLIGYPEKYRIGFKQARLHLFTAITTITAIIKKIPVLGLMLRLFNAVPNRIELFFGLYGGGSCFAFLEKPPSRNNEENKTSADI